MISYQGCPSVIFCCKLIPRKCEFGLCVLNVIFPKYRNLMNFPSGLNKLYTEVSLCPYRNMNTVNSGC